MNVAYNEISCADAARMIGVDYSSVVKWCRDGRINCVNVSGGTKSGRYVLKEDEVDYIKQLRQKFGKDYLKKYRKDWRKGKQPAQPIKEVIYVEPTKPVATIKSVVADVVPAKKRADIDELAIKIGYIQDIKDKLEELEIQKNQLTAELESLRKEVMEYL